MPCLRQSHREIGEVLGRGHMIGVEALIDEEDSHDNVGSVLKQNGPEVNLRPV
jgi:4-aminobutyrate aminotransferase-like enzyme